MKKKMVFFLTIFSLLLLVGGIYLLPSMNADALHVTVIGDTVNVRSGPGTTYNVVSQVHKGETFTVKKTENDWYEIGLPSDENAWVASWLVSTQSSTSSETSGTILTDHLNVRKEPALNGTILGKLHKGETVSIVEEKNGWTKITYDSSFAWISSDYVQASTKTKPAEPALSKGHLKILHDGTNIRKKPTVKSVVIQTASEHETYSILSRNGDWFEIMLNDGKSGYVASWIVAANYKNNSNSIGIAGKTIVIDPGHGGHDHGTTGYSGTEEKDLSLKTAKLLSSKLESKGAHVILTRKRDEYVSLISRTNQAYDAYADAFISLHYDSVDDQVTSGHTTYYYYNDEKMLAQSVHDAIANKVQLIDRGYRFGDYFVLRENRQPSILIELGYLSHPSEEQTIKTARYRETVTDAITEGLVHYFSK